VFLRTRTTAGRTYLLLVENERVDGRIKQRVLHRLGRLDQLQASGQLDSLLTSLGRFSDKLAVLGAHGRGECVTTGTRRIGAALIFERLWQESGIGAVLHEMPRERRFEFALERAVFMTVLHRLFVSGSDRAAERWMRDQAIGGTEALSLRHLYRAMGFVGEPLVPPAKDASVFDVRTRKNLVEEELFARRRDLFSDVGLVFFDTTSIYFEGEGGENIGQHGHSKDHRPDRKQMVVGMVLDNAGNPLCSTMWPGNTTDVKSLAPVVKRLQTHFGIQRVCVVADRGMVSEATIAEIEARGWLYILGVRMRRTQEAREEVLARAGRYQEVYPKSEQAKAPSPLAVKEGWVDERRYVVCRNEDQATKDAHDRLAIVSALSEALKRGDKSLLGNQGCRRFVAGSGARRRQVDRAHQHRAQRARGGVEVQAAVDGRGDLPHDEEPARHPPDLPQDRRHDPRSRVLQLPGAGAAQGAAGPARGQGPRRTRMGPHPRRPGRLAGNRVDGPGPGLPAAHRVQGDDQRGVRRLWRRAAADLATDLIVTPSVAPTAR